MKNTAHTWLGWPISDRSLPALIGLLLLGLGAGLSPFFFAYYNASVWVPIGLGLVAVSAVATVARPARPSGPAALALGGLLGLGVWSLASTAWAESVENAVVSGNRWLVYGALLMLMLVLLRSERRSAVLLGAAGLGVSAVAISVLARLLGGNPGTLFLGARLNSPLGYINGEGCLFVIGFWLCFAAAETRRAPVAALAVGMATLMACLAIPTQSRGTALAMFGFFKVIKANHDLAEARSRIAALATENERSRIARDLHDLLGHSLTTITVKAGLARKLGAADTERALREIAEVEELSRRALSEVRMAVANYRDRDVSLAGELANGRELLRAAGITADLPRAVDAVDPRCLELFGWVLREGLTNVVRHSRADACAVRLTRNSLEIADDGFTGSVFWHSNENGFTVTRRA